MTILKQGEIITIIEEKGQGRNRSMLTEAYNVKVLKDLNEELPKLFKDCARPSESLITFITRCGIGRIIPKRETFIYNKDRGTIKVGSEEEPISVTPVIEKASSTDSEETASLEFRLRYFILIDNGKKASDAIVKDLGWLITAKKILDGRSSGKDKSAMELFLSLAEVSSSFPGIISALTAHYPDMNQQNKQALEILRQIETGDI